MAQKGQSQRAKVKVDSVTGPKMVRDQEIQTVRIKTKIYKSKLY